MRILYSVQRYGESIVGGAEAAARAFAEQLANRGHHVEVVTSCAKSYVDWANEFDPGTSELNGVTVHRLEVDDVRRPEKFGPLHNWMISGPRPSPLFVQQRWAKHMGPDMGDLPNWMNRNIGRFDVAIFMTYMYVTTTRGMPAAAFRVPTVFQPTAHDEPPLRVMLYDTLFRLPDAFLFFTPEEREVVRRRFHMEPLGETVGIGIDLTRAETPEAFRRKFELGDDPYLLYVGRIDPIKGSRELFEFFCEYKRRNPSKLRLVLVGETISELPEHPYVLSTGFLDERDKRNACAGALALAQPSRFESFSIVVCESWVQQRPVLVHSDSEVLLGQARRASGGIPYRGFAEFESALDLLMEDRSLADRLGRNGRDYVEKMYDWPTVIDGVERCIETAADHFAKRSASRPGEKAEISRAIDHFE